MGAPLSILNTRGQSTDTIWGADGISKIKLAVGSVNAGLDESAAWQGVATHMASGTVGADDGVVLSAGVTEADPTLLLPFLVDASGRMITTPSGPNGGLLTDRSGSVTTGGTAQDAVASNTSRRYLFIQNADDNEDLWIDLGTNAVIASPSVRLRPWDTFVMEGTFVSTQRVSVKAATTGHKWTAKEG